MKLKIIEFFHKVFLQSVHHTGLLMPLSAYIMSWVLHVYNQLN